MSSVSDLRNFVALSSSSSSSPPSYRLSPSPSFPGCTCPRPDSIRTTSPVRSSLVQSLLVLLGKRSHTRGQQRKYRDDGPSTEPSHMHGIRWPSSSSVDLVAHMMQTYSAILQCKKALVTSITQSLLEITPLGSRDAVSAGMNNSLARAAWFCGDVQLLLPLTKKKLIQSLHLSLFKRKPELWLEGKQVHQSGHEHVIFLFSVFTDAGDDAPSQRNLTCASASVASKGR